MALPPTQPPGWYYAQGDPPATHRWWDGAQWVGGPVANGASAYNPTAMYPSAGVYGARPRFANFGQRLGAFLLDSLILAAPLVVFSLIFFAAAPTEIEPCVIDGRRRLCEGPTDGAMGLYFLVIAVAVLAWGLLYQGRLQGRTGQTLGKKAVGIKTVRIQTGQPLGTGRSIGRFFAHWVSSLVCYLGYLWMIWDSESQTWHDKMTDAIVIKADG